MPENTVTKAKNLTSPRAQNLSPKSIEWSKNHNPTQIATVNVAVAQAPQRLVSSMSSLLFCFLLSSERTVSLRYDKTTDKQINWEKQHHCSKPTSIFFMFSIIMETCKLGLGF